MRPVQLMMPAMRAVPTDAIAIDSSYIICKPLVPARITPVLVIVKPNFITSQLGSLAVFSANRPFPNKKSISDSPSLMDFFFAAGGLCSVGLIPTQFPAIYRL